jgi:hypothetical protein
MSTLSKDRIALLLATARSNPDFGARLLQKLPVAERDQVLGQLSRPVTRETTKLTAPGLKKCRAAKPVNNGLSAQLNLFARVTARVG